MYEVVVSVAFCSGKGERHKMSCPTFDQAADLMANVLEQMHNQYQVWITPWPHLFIRQSEIARIEVTIQDIPHSQSHPMTDEEFIEHQLLV